MSDMNSLVTILLAEVCLVLLIALIVVLWLQAKAKGKQRKAVEQLVSQIKQQSKTRTEETGSFLQLSYDLSGDELTSAVTKIDKQERKFFQIMVNVLAGTDTSQIVRLDSSVAELVDTYKSLKPKAAEVTPDNGSEEKAAEIVALKTENEVLQGELNITRETMSNMMNEFGNMFGGGKDHELDNDEVSKKVTAPEPIAGESDESSNESGEQADPVVPLAEEPDAASSEPEEQADPVVPIAEEPDAASSEPEEQADPVVPLVEEPDAAISEPEEQADPVVPLVEEPDAAISEPEEQADPIVPAVGEADAAITEPKKQPDSN